MSKPQLFRSGLWARGKSILALQAILLTVLIQLLPAQAQTCASAGKDGPGGTLTGIVNTYYPGTANAAAGAKSISVGTSRGAATAIANNDLLLVIQMQDAAINSNNSSRYGDGVNGGIGSGYTTANNSGLYEFVKATGAVSGGAVAIVGTGTGGGLINSYTNADYVAGTQGQRRFQVVRVPQYTTARLSSGLTASAWNGTTGGIIALDIKDAVELSGTVSVDGLGFRGGAALRMTGGSGADTDYRFTAPTSATTTTGNHGSKGEGIAGTPRYVWNSATTANVDTGVEGYPNGSMGYGAPGNAGGGGTDSDPANNQENSGGGGGGNGGAGGRGGNCWSSQATTGGYAGVVFAEVSQGRIVMGGGGGSGTRNNSDNITGASSGAAGGGIVIIRTRKVLGTGTITANGASAFNNTDNDGGGGGGGGGSVIFFALSSTLTGLTINANGGRGGDAWHNQAANGDPGERHGPGGGGGGGVIYTSSTPAARTVTAGANGITTTSSVAYGATAGAVGITGTVTSGQIPGVSSGPECSAPSAVTLTHFAAAVDPGGNVLLEWKTGYEISNLGFNLYRDSGGKRIRLNSSIVGGTALLAGARTAFTAGFAYAWMDKLASPKEVPAYWLEDLDTGGKTVLHGPISPVAVSKLPQQAQSLMLSQLRTNAPGTTIETVSVAGAAARGPARRVSSQNLQTQWEVAAKPGAKILATRIGWYRVSQPELVAAGFDVSKDPRFLQLFVDGTEVPLIVNGGLAGRLEPQDSIEFFATGVNAPSSNSRAYYLLNGAQAGRRVNVLSPGSGNESRRLNFRATVERRDRFLYFPTISNGDSENWFGNVIYPGATDLTMTLRQLDQDATDDATLEIALQGLNLTSTQASHLVGVQVNGQAVGSIAFDTLAYQVAQLAVSSRLLQEGANTITLTGLGGSGDYSTVDWLKLSYARRFVADQSSLQLTATGGEAVRVTGFSSSTVRVFDITDESSPSELRGIVEAEGKGYRVTVTAADAGERVLLMVSDKGYERAAGVVSQAGSNWHDASQGADVVMVAHASVKSALEPLAQLRRQQGYAVAVMDVEDVYDEWSYGQRTAQALQDMIVATRGWKRVPKWVMLVGDASYDPKNYLGLGDNDMVPTKLVWTNTFETASDDWLGDVNGDGVADVAIGRLPVRTLAQAQAVVSKILNYERSSGTEGAVLVADLPGEYDFEAASQAVKDMLPTGLDVQEIYRSRMDDTTANRAIIDAVNRGPKLVNYAGHGSSGVWRGNLLTNDSAEQLTNQQELPVVVSMTCLNGLFNDPRSTSLGETLLLSDRGGAIAVWASSAQTVAAAQEMVDQEMVRQLFKGADEKGRPVTFGEAVQRAKAVAHNEAVIQSWILLGDPLVRMR